MKQLITASFLALSCGFITTVHAQAEVFSTGPIVEGFGENAPIENGLPAAADQNLKVLFDLSAKNETDKPLRQLNTVARFINMHARAGVAPKNIKAAAVIHGGASFELLSNKAYESRFGKPNPSAKLIQALLDAGTEIELCGQSATYHQINREDLLPGIKVSLSAMTSNALFQQKGYTLNPF